MLIELAIGDAYGAGFESVHAAVTALQASGSMTSLLRTCIAYTGDVDTVATIALAAAAGSTEVDQDLPEHLLMGLENDRYGREFLHTLDERLLANVVDVS